MKKILTISSNDEVINIVKQASKKFVKFFSTDFLWETPKQIQRINAKDFCA